MKRIILLLTLLVSTGMIFSQTTKIWEKSDASGTFPAFMSKTSSTERGFAYGSIQLHPTSIIWETSQAKGNYPAFMGTVNTERGFAFGNVNGNDRIYLVSRKGGNNVIILNAANGDSVGTLDITGVSGGTFPINDAEVSSDGVIFACNLTTNASTSAFKVYKWTSESAAPVEVINYTDLTNRFGDKFNVTGSASDNSLTIWAASPGSDKILKFTTADNGASFTPTVITLSNGNLGNQPVVVPNNDASMLYVNSAGTLVSSYQPNGTFVDTISGGLISIYSDAMKYFEINGKKYLAVFNYGIGNENLRIADVTNGLGSANIIDVTNSLGPVVNGNGAGDVGVKINSDNTANLYMLSTNNGLAGYKLNPSNVGTAQRLYVVSRNGGTNVVIMDAETGDSVGTLNMTGISGGNFFLNDAEVSSDGVIFACNLTVSASSSAFKVYKWTSETAAPEAVIDYTGLATRFGDKFTVTGSTADNSLTIWAASTNSDKIVKFTTSDNGATFTPTEITLSNGNLGNQPVVVPSNDGNTLYTNSASTLVTSYKADGTFIDTLSGGFVSSYGDALKYFEIAGRDYLAIYNYGIGNENLRIVDITSGLSDAALIGTTPSLGSQSNGNGSGDVGVQLNADSTANIYILATNNGLGAYKFTPPAKVATPVFAPAAGTYYDSVDVAITVNTVNAKIYYTLDGTTPTDTSTLYSAPIKFTDTTTIKAVAYLAGMTPSDVNSATYNIVVPVDVNTIADLRSSPLNGVYRLKGEAVLTFQQSFRNQKFVQDSTGGIMIDDNSGMVTTQYSEGDGITGITGTLTEFGNMLEFTPGADPGAATSTENKIVPIEISLNDFINNFGKYESRVVTINHLSFVGADGSAKFANGKTYPVTDGIDTIQFRTTFYDVNYINSVIPMDKINLTGIPNARSTGNYITARNLSDLGIILPPAEPVYQLWAKTQAAGNYPSYFSTSYYERGMAYGKVNGKDRVYVLGRLGGPKIFVFDAMTGDTAGIIYPTSEVSGGTFPLDFVDVSDDGIIFAANLTIDVSSSAFKVYRWDSEQDTPKTVIDYTNMNLKGGRLGDIFSVFGKASDNSLVIYAAVSGQDKIVKFTTSDNGMSFTPEVITLSNGKLGTVPNVAVASDGTLYIKSYSHQLYHYQSDGTLIDSISSAVIGTDVTDIKYIRYNDKDFIMCYYPNDSAPYSDERFTIVNVTNPLSASVVLQSPSIGNISNLNATGAVDYMPLNSKDYLFFIQGSNNGLAAFSSNPSTVVNNLDTLFYGNTRTLLKNPNGSGFIAGTNSNGDLGKYEKFDLQSGDKLAGFKLYFGYKQIVGDPDTLNLVVKTVGSNGAPDSTIAKMQTTTDMLDTSGGGNTFILPASIELNGPVFVGFEFTGTANDTIALFTDKDGEGDNADRAWEKLKDGSYNDFGTMLNANSSWNKNIDLWIAAYYKKAVPVGVENNITAVPKKYSLDQNYPNPFNPTTTIRFSIKVSANVELKIYNILGQQVAVLMNKEMKPGIHSVQFNASNLASGVYFYRLQVKGADGSQFNSVKKLMLLK